MATQIIRTGAGEVELVEAHVPASSTDRMIALGSDYAPAGWRSPDAVQTIGDEALLWLYVGPGHLNPLGGVYRVWTRHTDPDGQVLVTPTSTTIRVVTDSGTPLPANDDWATTQFVRDYVAQHGGSGGPGGGATVVDNGNGTFTITP